MRKLHHRPPRVRKEVQVTRAGYKFIAFGVPVPGLQDLYHILLRVRWWAALGTIVVLYLLVNAVFAGLYLLVGGVANVGHGSFLDAFFFSVQTMGTIGYGTMYPETRAANFLVVVESVTGLIATALATGLIFVRFSHSRARVMFSRVVTISPMDGVPTLMIRLGNERRGQIVDVQFRLSIARTERSKEGVLMYRTRDLSLVRERIGSLSRSWSVQHRIEPGSLLHGATPESLEAAEAEVNLSITGLDDTSLQPMYASYNWSHKEILWGRRLSDVISENEDGNIHLDLRKFHDHEETEPTEEFPYPLRASQIPDSDEEPRSEVRDIEGPDSQPEDEEAAAE